MSGDFLQNLITRHLGLDPTLQPSPTSRFETANSVSLGVGIGENLESTSEPQHFQAVPPISDAPNSESRLDNFVPEHIGRERQEKEVSPPMATDVASELKIGPKYPDVQQDLNISPESTIPHQEQNVGQLSVSAHEARIMSSKILSPAVSKDERMRDSNQFDISELAELFAGEKRIVATEESSDKRVADTSLASQTPPNDIVLPKTSDSSGRNVGYKELAEMVRQLRDEISADKEIAVSKIREKQELVVPPSSVQAEWPLYSPIANNFLLREPKIPGRETKPEPVINVTIGRVEVRAVHQPDPPKPKRQQPTKVMSLDNYLRKRGGENS